ncbi:MAG: sulfatase-like hydrolase/transferase [Planctomycetota bacterium]|nr:sulfatase-like hydrolase/transferase [Planctomycetota bacterium]
MPLKQASFKSWCSFLALFVAVLLSCSKASAQLPNILWITAEDLSPSLGCYGDPDADTPYLDALASRSTVFTNAFATSSVCSTARNCLITGCYPTSLGTMHMRSAYPIPKRIVGFPKLLRDAGYYTSNNVKTDYNIRDPGPFIEACWNENSSQAHWRNRPNKQMPFFAVFNLMESHQSRSMVWISEKFEQEIRSQLPVERCHSPASVRLPSFYVDTPVVRREWARYHDCVSVMDLQVGRILKQLKEDGLADNTIVFFFGDHGAGMPRHKRALLDSGTHVPLIVHVPESIRKSNSTFSIAKSDRLVSFVDLAPTTLELCGVESPKHMQGLKFSSSEQRERKYAFAHRDRVDEARDLSRAIRDKRFLYIRNYMPHLGYNQPTAWPDQGALRKEFYKASIDSRTQPHNLSPAQWHFLAPQRPREELYDCVADPENTHNLASDPVYRKKLRELQLRLSEHQRDTQDCGFMPETLLMRNSNKSPVHVQLLARQYAAHANLAWEAKSDIALRNLIYEPDRLDAALYWAAVTSIGRPRLSRETKSALAECMNSGEAWTRIAAAHSLATHGFNKAVPVLGEFLQDQDLNVVLQAMRSIELLGDKAKSLRPRVEFTAKKFQSMLPTQTTATFEVSPEQDLAMFIGFAAGAFLDRTKDSH